VGVILYLRSIIAIKSQEREKKRFLDFLNLREDTSFTLTPYGSLFGPASGNIYEVNDIGENVWIMIHHNELRYRLQESLGGTRPIGL
jgi:hypothetical protein